MVIGHEASLSGAPVLLFNLFKLLIDRGIVDVQFVIRRGGPLTELYKEIAPVTVLKQPKYGEEKTMILHVLHWIENKIKLFRVFIEAFSCDYLFFNTVVNGRLLRWFHFHHKPVITYVHELEKVIDLYLKKNDAVLPLSVSDAIAYPSHTTEALLLNKYKIPAYKLKKLSYFFPFKENEYDCSRASEIKKAFRRKFGIDNDNFLVGAVGVVSERKGFDLFIEVCEKVANVNPSIKFVWIGAFESNEQELNIRNVIKEKQLESNLIFTGPLYYNIYNFSPFDIFFLSSREDTYPLVVLEAAIMKVPSICFSGSGGIVEFIGGDAGWVVDDFSTSKASDKVIELHQKRSMVRLYGNVAFNKVISRHCNPDSVIDQYNAIVQDLLSEKSGSKI
jgi:glycosyltransferase involved in cell wall biosynthesis